VQTPVLILSGISEMDSKVRSFGFGADDYVTKDMSLDHLFARIAALLRRTEAWAQSSRDGDEVLQRGALRVNVDRMTATWNEQPVELTVTEFWMLHALVHHPGHVRNRTQLMEAASTVLDDNTVTSHIKRIRKKFQQLDGTFDAIQTAYGFGYRWKAHEG
jgi:two-component system OmpR family response regulator